MTESRTVVHVSPSVMGRIRTSSRIRHSAAPADVSTPEHSLCAVAESVGFDPIHHLRRDPSVEVGLVDDPLAATLVRSDLSVSEVARGPSLSL
jgi:hypothetical protein